MGIKERHTRERENVRSAILTAARSLFLTEGYANVSMRKIAEQIEYSPGAIYSYFPCKEDIFFALAEEGLQLLRAHCTSEPHPPVPSPPLDHVRNAIWRFYTFSKEQPEYFSLIFVDEAVPRISRDWERFSFVRQLRQGIEEQIQKCIQTGVFPGAVSAPSVFRVLSTAVYGASVFRLSNRLAPGEDADALAHDVLEAALGGLQAGIRLRFEACSDTREPLPATASGQAGHAGLE
jgi:AcrR family transcriptional regulator